MNCKKVPIGVEELKRRLRQVSSVLVTRGKKLLEFDPERDQAEILKTAIGRSGNLRAPSLRNGSLLIVGFTEEAYQRLT